MTDVQKRKIKLVDYAGREFDLLGYPSSYLDKNATPFLNEPTGFGFEIDTEVVRALNEDILSEYSYKFPEITGTLIFYTYDKYREFINFIMKGQNMDNITFGNQKSFKLYYQTLEEESDLYYNVIIKKVEKGEKGDNFFLECPVTFQRLTHLKEDIVLEQKNNVDVDSLSTFALPTSGTNFIKYNSKTTIPAKFRFIIRNNTNLPIPAKLTISGKYNNPSWKNFKNNLEGRYRLNASNKTLVIDARNPQLIEEDGLNVIDSIDYTKNNNFLIISPGINIIQIITEEDGLATSSTSVKIEYSREIIS